MNSAYKKAFLCSAALALILSIDYGFQSSAAAEEKIKIEKSSEEIALQPAGAAQPSTLEAEFEKLIGKFSKDVVFEIETASGDTGETISRSAKIMIKDTETVRIETSLSNGMQLIITSAAGDGWIYFPKTNMIMEIKPGGKKSSAAAAGADFISDFLANRPEHVINKNAAGNSTCYEIAEKKGGRVINYHFSKDELLEKIIINEKNKASEEIVIKKTSFGPIEESVFTRPKNAFKMPVNEFPDFDY